MCTEIVKNAYTLFQPLKSFFIHCYICTPIDQIVPADTRPAKGTLETMHEMLDRSFISSDPAVFKMKNLVLKCYFHHTPVLPLTLLHLYILLHVSYIKIDITIMYSSILKYY